MKKNRSSKHGVTPSLPEPSEKHKPDGGIQGAPVNLARGEGLITSSLPGWAGLVALWVGFYLWKNCGAESWKISSWIIALMLMVMAPIEAWQSRKFRTGIVWNKIQGLRGFPQKLTGLTITIVLMGSLYWVFPEYSGDFYAPFYGALKAYWPWLTGFLILTTLVESLKEDDPTKDPSYQIGNAVLELTAPQLTKEEWKNHFLSWLIKLFFLPLMFVYMNNYIKGLQGAPTVFTGHPMEIYNIVYQGLYFIDTAFVCVGYAFANKIAGTQVRSAEKTAVGWLSALVCYQPFWSTIGKCYISYGQDFGKVISQSTSVQWVYCSLIILAIIPYIWATVAFGSRFSNLTHRGILFTGPYKYFRHPAYIFKLISYFLIFTPFIASSFQHLWGNIVMFGLLCIVYRVRALTEEANLRSMGPEYDEYCEKVHLQRKKISERIFGC